LPHEADAASSGPIRQDSDEAKALCALDDEATTSLAQREAAIRDLLKTTEGALALAALLHRGGLDEPDSRLAVGLGAEAASSDIRGLFETFVPEAKRRATLGPAFDPQTVLSRTGERERGKLIFFSDGARCRACHEVDDRSQSLGPTLQEIVKKYPQPAELLQHVLQPSLKIEEPFAAYVILTNEGRVITGLLGESTDKDFIIRTAEKQTLRIPRQSVDEMRKSEQSLMPERILSDLTAQEAADLLDYLRSQAPPPAGRP
jgi:putative heme-binding domain-containing protein